MLNILQDEINKGKGKTEEDNKGKGVNEESSKPDTKRYKSEYELRVIMKKREVFHKHRRFFSTYFMKIRDLLDSGLIDDKELKEFINSSSIFLIISIHQNYKI